MVSLPKSPLSTLERKSRRDPSRYSATGFVDYFPFSNDIHYDSRALQYDVEQGLIITVGGIGSVTDCMLQGGGEILVVDANPDVSAVSRRIRDIICKQPTPDQSVADVKQVYQQETSAFEREVEGLGEHHWSTVLNYEKFRLACNMGKVSIVSANLSDPRFAEALSSLAYPRCSLVNFTNIHEYMTLDDLKKIFRTLPTIDSRTVIQFSRVAQGGGCRVGYAKGGEGYLNETKSTIGKLAQS